ncbi:MAG: (d)CMP kinase [bacterium]
MRKNFQIAIDGPVAAGKGTAAKIVAARLEFLYVDTGAMYRGLTLFVKERGVKWESEKEIAALLENEKPQVELSIPSQAEKDGRLCTVKLNGEDVSWKIRTEDISHGVSVITQYAGVRDYVTPMARKIAETQNVVMEGRDITTVVLPNADLKVYMDARPRERAERRYKELISRGEDIALDEVYQQLMERDKRDSEREIAPLKKAEGAWVLDTSELTIEEVVNLIVKRVETIRQNSRKV